MQYDHEKVDEAVLALLYLTMHNDHGVLRAWKGMDWDALDRLHQKDLIDDPKNKNKSIVFTEEGARRSKELFERLFGNKPSLEQ